MKFFNAALISVFMGLFGVFAFFFPVTESGAVIVKALRTFFCAFCLLFWAFALYGFKAATKNALNVWVFAVSACFAIADTVILIITFI